MTAQKPTPIDTDILLTQMNREAQRVAHARTGLALACLGLITARIRADHPTARFLELSFNVCTRSYTGRTEAGRVWLSETGQMGRWRACLDIDARTDLEGWCVHIGQDVADLLPAVWVEDRTTGLRVVDLDAVVAALPSARPVL